MSFLLDKVLKLKHLLFKKYKVKQYRAKDDGAAPQNIRGNAASDGAAHGALWGPAWAADPRSSTGRPDCRGDPAPGLACRPSLA